MQQKKPKSIYSVTQINSYIKNMFTQDYMLRSVYVRGEVSNVKYHSSNHIYFTLKDDKAAIACVMFAGKRAGLKFKLENGQQVVCGGSVNIYERDGRYQIYAEDIVLDGAGALYEKFERLKRELEETGMFAKEYKKPIPKFAQTVGVVTAGTGAAIQDIINISKRRNPYVQLILYPARVQGDGAAESIVSGIRALDALNPDVIIIGRGGGSIEDLWAFNEEIVARAIFECQTPVISGVGHETDTTIADFVADLRAPTPSAAAELAVFDYDDYKEKLFDIYNAFRHRITITLNDRYNRLRQAKLIVEKLNPEYIFKQKQTQLIYSEEKLRELMNRILSEKKHQYEVYINQMKALSPLDKLSKGYAYVKSERGIPLTSVDTVNTGDELNIILSDGNIKSTITEIEHVSLKFSNDTAYTEE